MKKTIQLLAIAAAAVAAGLVVHKGLTAQVPGYASPYTISYKIRHSRTDGVALPNTESIKTVSRRSNGDLAEISPQRRSVRFVSQGILVAVNDAAHLTTTYGSGKPGEIINHQFGPNCESFAEQMHGESKIILGFKALKVTGTPRYQAASATGDISGESQEAWIVPALDCQPLEETTTWLMNGKVYGATIKIATNASADSQDSFFALPESATEVPPSVFYASLGASAPPNQEAYYNKQKAARAALGKP